MTLGIIDVGTNSIHLLVGVLGLSGKFHILLKERELTRLGEGGLARGRLTGRAMRRALQTLSRYAAIMKRCGVERIEAVATSAVREAANGRALARRVRKQLRIPLRIISGREEARLIYLGVLQAVRFHRPTAIVTIGGGSAQVMSGEGTRPRYMASVPLGGARLAQRFIRHDPPRPGEVEALRRHVERTWAPVVRAMRRHRWQRALGSSATIYQLMAAADLLTRSRGARGSKRPLSISRRSLERLVAWLADSTAPERIQLPGLDPRREDLALTTGIVLLAWMAACRVRRLRYASGSLREGLVVDYLIRHHRRASRRLASSAGLAEPSNGNSRRWSVPRRMLTAGTAKLPRLTRSEKP